MTSIFNEKKMPDAYTELANGALLGLSNGASMDCIASIVELTDNAVDADASVIDIIIDNSNESVAVYSVEKTNLQQSDYGKIFTLGTSSRATITKKVGKYKQGLKYSVANLIGDGRKGYVKIDVKPENGERWSIMNKIDYTNENAYSDRDLFLCKPSSVLNEYDFAVEIKGVSNFTDKNMTLLKMSLGLRYRELIVNSKLVCRINGSEVIPQDRLYANYGDRAGYHKSQYFEYMGNPKAIKFEWSDLSESHFSEIELCEYDTSLGIKGRNSGVMVTNRAGLEIAINDITVINDGVLEDLTGVELQPSGAPFRGRLTIYDTRLSDKYISGGNKSNCSINKSFATDDETKEIRLAIKNAHSTVLTNNRNRNKQESINNKLLDKWCQNNDLTLRFIFFAKDATRKTFIYDKDNNVIEISLESNLLKECKNDVMRALFIKAIVQDTIFESSEKVIEKLKSFEYDAIKNGLIKD